MTAFKISLGVSLLLSYFRVVLNPRCVAKVIFLRSISRAPCFVIRPDIAKRIKTISVSI